MQDNEILEKIFKNVNDWLNFAERKNVTVLSIFGIIAVMSLLNLKQVHIVGKIGVCIYMAAYLAVLISSLVSLFPVRELSAKLKNGLPNVDKSETDNMWFYQHIRKYSVDDYKTLLEKKNVQKYDKGHEELIPQILANSHIACKKFTCFTVSFWCSIIGFSIAIILLLISFFLTK